MRQNTEEFSDAIQKVPWAGVKNALFMTENTNSK